MPLYPIEMGEDGGFIVPLEYRPAVKRLFDWYDEQDKKRRTIMKHEVTIAFLAAACAELRTTIDEMTRDLEGQEVKRKNTQEELDGVLEQLRNHEIAKEELVAAGRGA